MKLTLVLGLLLASLSSFAQYSPPYPNQDQYQDQYQDQSQDQYQDQYQDQRTGGGYYIPPQPRPQYRPSCPNRCPRSSCRPTCPPPRREIPNCQVVMVDCYDRVIARYDGFLDYPSRACGGALRQCNRDMHGTRDGARCLQSRR